MAIRRSGQDKGEVSPEVMSRWSEAVSKVGARFQDLQALPLEEAVEVAAMRTPGSFSREELARQMAATRQRDAQPGMDPRGEGS